MVRTASVKRDSEIQQCIDNCTQCGAICVETVQHCLRMGGEHAEEGHIRLMLDCAEICQTSATFMLRSSPHHHLVCNVCATLCEECADDCERLAGDDQQMRRCVQICRECADSCAKMATRR